MSIRQRTLPIGIVLLAVVATRPCQADPPSGPYDSPRLARLAKELRAGNKDVLESFWKEVQGKAPLVEPVTGDESRRWVTFLFRGTSTTHGAALRGGLPVSADFNRFTKLPGTDLWYLTQAYPSDARFCYFFLQNPPESEPRTKTEAMFLMLRMRSDALNPRTHVGRSMLELPDARREPLLERRPEVARGKLSKHKLSSTILKGERNITLYESPGDASKGPPGGLLILFDGDAYLTEIPVPIILDNLFAQAKIPRLLTVFVHQKDRSKELACSEPFADFLARELVPWVHKHSGVSADPANTIVGGLSLGGLMAAYCGFRHPEVFGKVLSQSGSFWYFPGALEISGPPPAYLETGWLTRQFVKSPRLPVRFALEVGCFEVSFTGNMVLENRRLRDVLQARGYDVRYAEFTGGHDGLSWRVTFPGSLQALLAPQPSKKEGQP